jgi:very-short-patch-repair endonuclease
LLDISELLPVREVEWALDEALGRKLVTLDELRQLLDRTTNQGGMTILRGLIAWRTSNTGSRTKWERRAASAFREAGFPPFEQNVWHLGYQHDFLWRAHRVTLEIDSLQWHALPSRMARDEAKDATLRAHGFDPNRVTNAQIDHHILAVVALVATRLALRDPGGAPGAAQS